MNKTVFGLSGLLTVVLAAPLTTAQTIHRNVTSTAAAMNRGIEKAHPVDANVPNQSDAQPESEIDADLADRVRRSVVADRNLSSYAAKINIVAADGNVRLSGLVQNDGEKAQIASKAAAIAGQRHVVNDLRIMTNVADGKGLRDLLERAAEPRPAVVAAN